MNILMKFIKSDSVVAIGTGALGEMFLQELINKVKSKHLNVEVVPTSYKFASMLNASNVSIASINEKEIDLAIEFADSIDNQFNYIKRDSTSLVRDKMIAMSALEEIVVVEKEKYGKLDRIIPMEAVDFGLQKTLIHLESLGEVQLRMKGKNAVRTETDNYLIDVKVDKVYSLDDIETESKKIPGVIETGLFLGYCDRVILRSNEGYEIKSRIQEEEPSKKL